MHDVNAGKKEKKKDDTTDRWTQLHWLFHYVCLEICGPGIYGYYFDMYHPAEWAKHLQ